MRRLVENTTAGREYTLSSDCRRARCVQPHRSAQARGISADRSDASPVL
ncbi:MAG TPA: transcriptional regulator [Planctomycetaceae bacterium]|nr:transcriptional regulator [Planctomycetaceae bacterium]